MKREAVLLNLGRGPIINDADLASCDMAVELGWLGLHIEIGTLEEITSGGVCWITLRHQWGNCPKPEGLSFDPLVK